MTSLIISNEEMNDFLEIVQSQIRCGKGSHKLEQLK